MPFAALNRLFAGSSSVVASQVARVVSSIDLLTIAGQRTFLPWLLRHRLWLTAILRRGEKGEAMKLLVLLHWHPTLLQTGLGSYSKELWISNDRDYDCDRDDCVVMAT